MIYIYHSPVSEGSPEATTSRSAVKEGGGDTRGHVAFSWGEGRASPAQLFGTTAYRGVLGTSAPFPQPRLLARLLGRKQRCGDRWHQCHQVLSLRECLLFCASLIGATEEPRDRQLSLEHPEGGREKAARLLCVLEERWCQRCFSSENTERGPKPEPVPWNLRTATLVGCASSHRLRVRERLGPELSPTSKRDPWWWPGLFGAASGGSHQPRVSAAACLFLRCQLPTCVAESKSSSPWASRRAAPWPPWRTPSATWPTRGRPPTRTWGWTDRERWGAPRPPRTGAAPGAGARPGLSWGRHPARSRDTSCLSERHSQDQEHSCLCQPPGDRNTSCLSQPRSHRSFQSLHGPAPPPSLLPAAARFRTPNCFQDFAAGFIF